MQSKVKACLESIRAVWYFNSCFSKCRHLVRLSTASYFVQNQPEYRYTFRFNDVVLQHRMARGINALLLMRINFHSFIQLLLILTLFASCTSENRLDEEAMNISAAEADQRYNYIHKLIYDNPLEAREEALRILETLKPNDYISEIILLKHIGSSYVFETNNSEAVKYYNQALAIAEQHEVWAEVAHINNNLGVIFNEIANYKMAYIHLVEALNYYDIARLTHKKTGAYNNIGIIYMNLRNYDKALSYFEQATDTSFTPGDTILVISALNNIALCYNSKENPSEALHHLERAIELSKKVNNKYGLCISYQLMGNVYLKLDQPTESLEAYSMSRDIANEGNLSYQLALARLGLGQVYLRTGKQEEAFKMAFEVLNMAKEHESLTLESDAHQLLSGIYEQESDFKNGLFHYQKHISTQQEVINQTVIHQIYDVELNYLNQLNKMQQLELEKKELSISKKNNLLFFISLTFIMLLVGLYLIYLNHHHRQEVKFQRTVIELTEKKSDAALEAEIRERKRIGQELHDSLGHLLSVAGLHASVLQKRKNLSVTKKDELLEALMRTIDDAFDEVRNISHNLAPSLLSEHGLKGALKSISDKVNQSTRLTMSFDTFGLNGKMDKLIENTLFRTIQEIVNNTIKHAEASQLFIQITQGEHEITLMAEDNGKGFDTAAIEQLASHGLSHMKSRIEKHNGTMHIDSNTHRGTIISILIPLKESTA
ncbi:MAG: tetratricopeptide repeat protein [Bacteroidales bacterium]|nr:tetratricopeptide repeat protein [Bacteroidales bacterium]